MVKLHELINQIKSAKVYSQSELEVLWERDRSRIKAAIDRMLATGETLGVALGGPAFLNLPEDQFRQHLKNTNNDLDVQVKIVADDFSQWSCHVNLPFPRKS